MFYSSSRNDTDDAVHHSFSLLLESSTSQLEAHISSIEDLISIFEHLHVLKTSSSYRTVVAAVTEAHAVRSTADKEIADLIEQYKSYQDQFKQLLLKIPVHERNYERSALEQSIISLAV